MQLAPSAQEIASIDYIAQHALFYLYGTSTIFDVTMAVNSLRRIIPCSSVNVFSNFSSLMVRSAPLCVLVDLASLSHIPASL